MIQVNLLPKVKLEYVKATRNKRLTMLVSFLAAASGVAVMVGLFIIVNVIQEKYSNDLSKDIANESAKLESITDLEKVLTIQNQLNSLGPLHDEKPVVSRLLKYIESLTPNDVAITELNVDFETNTITIVGSSETIRIVNQYVDTLKFTNFTLENNPEELPAFSNVVLGSFSKDSEGATYEITASFDPQIFSSQGSAKLIVPKNKITTRSETEKPKNLFKEVPDEEKR